MRTAIEIGCYRGSLTIREDGSVAADVPPATIAHGLAAVTRFGGQTPRPYVVGEHSVKLAWLLDHVGYEQPVYKAAALVHDAPEGFGIGDVNTFIKRAFGLDGLRVLDRTMVETLWTSLGCRDHFGADWCEVEEPVHRLDKFIGHYEAYRFYGLSFVQRAVPEFDVHRYGDTDCAEWAMIEHWDYSWAKQMWLQEWENCHG